MTKRIFQLLCATALVTGLAACDAKKPEGGDEKLAKADGAAEGGEAAADADGEVPTAEGDEGGEGEEPELPDPATPEGKVALAAMVAGAIANEPAKADEILDQHGLDREGLDELMYEIATDPDMREEYAVAFAEARTTSTG